MVRRRGFDQRHGPAPAWRHGPVGQRRPGACRRWVSSCAPSPSEHVRQLDAVFDAQPGWDSDTRAPSRLRQDAHVAFDHAITVRAREVTRVTGSSFRGARRAQPGQLSMAAVRTIQCFSEAPSGNRRDVRWGSACGTSIVPEPGSGLRDAVDPSSSCDGKTVECCGAADHALPRPSRWLGRTPRVGIH
jgi:hypothetical protein